MFNSKAGCSTVAGADRASRLALAKRDIMAAEGLGAHLRDAILQVGVWKMASASVMMVGLL